MTTSAIDRQLPDQQLPERTASPAQTSTPPGGTRPPRRVRSFARGLRTFAVVLVLLAAAVVGGGYIVRERMLAHDYVDLGTAVLTAEAVPVGATDAAVVGKILVGEQAHVAAGDALAEVTLTAVVPSTAGAGTAGTVGTAGGGTRAAQTQVLRAPMAGTVAAVNTAVGAVVSAGGPVVTLYDKTKLTFQAKVPVAVLRRLRLGMTAYVEGPGLANRVAVTVQRIVPRVGTDPATGADQLTVVLVPKLSEVATVSTLVPGLLFAATVDTTTASGGTPAVNSAG
jgi:multidrug efflux pump subunit AcrA (membrane-fusion protein)